MRLPHAEPARPLAGPQDRPADPLIRAATTVHAVTDPRAGLSAREIQVLRMVAIGYSNQQIATLLFRSHSTVATHLRNIFAKISVRNRTEAAAFAFRNRLLDD